MTTQDLGRTPRQRLGDDPVRGMPRRLDAIDPTDSPNRSADDRDDGALGALFESSPDFGVRTSAAAVTGFLAGLSALLAAPFTLTMAVSIGLAALALVSSVVGLARASRATVAGGVLASLGLVLSLATAALVGLRYAGIDTAVGDDVLPTIADWLAALNGLVPAP